MSAPSVTLTLCEADARLLVLAVMHLERERRKAPHYVDFVIGDDNTRASYLEGALADAAQLHAIKERVLEGLSAPPARATGLCVVAA